jgi:hypothetical protein
MTLRESVLEQVEQFIVTEYLSISNVCFFMQSIRILLEIDQDKSKYEFTSHYCNWLLHKELDKSSSPVIIEEIRKSFNDFSSKNDLIKKITEALSVKKLVEELKEILWTKIENKILVSKMDFDGYWLNFITVLLNLIVLRPLKVKKTHIEIEKFNFTIYGIQLVHEKEKVCVEILSIEFEQKNKRMIADIALLR